jgi:hypothetical protein
MMRNGNLLAALATFALLMAVPPTAESATASVPDRALYANLYPTDAEPDASRDAVWDWNYTIHPPHTRTVFSVEVWDVLSTNTVQVWIDGEFITDFSLTDGHGRRVLDTDNGDQVPDVVGGSFIEITDEWGNILLDGIFG